MPKRYRTINRVFVLIFVLFIPIIGLYGYSNWRSVVVVQDQVQMSNISRLQFFRSQIDSRITQLLQNTIALMSDPDIKQWKYWTLFSSETPSSSSKVELIKRINAKLVLQSAASGWSTDIAVYSPVTRDVLTTNEQLVAEMMSDSKETAAQWRFRQLDRSRRYMFITTLVDPFDAIRQHDETLRFHIAFYEQDLRNMLDHLKNEGRSNPFLYHLDGHFIINSDASPVFIRRIAGALRDEPLQDVGYRNVMLDGQRYFVAYVQSKTLGWFLIDCEPLERIFEPITSSRNLFYTSAVFLVLFSVVLAFVLHRSVKLPIKKLMTGVRRLKDGDYSIRVVGRHNNEFDFLSDSFNEMAAEIEHLIQNVLREKLFSREATLKQLQSQINPHFLYNCLHFINIMNHQGNHEAVAAMVLNLGDYYRYTTRLENPLSTIRDELHLVKNYLEIQNLRMQRLSYDIAVPETMLDLAVPRLLLQPIIENAIVHGIDHKKGPCRIRITGTMQYDTFRITVEDSGAGMSDEALARLRHSLTLPLDDQRGFGVWNVHHRLVNYYGKDAGLELDHSTSGGLIINLNGRMIRKEGAIEA